MREYFSRHVLLLPCPQPTFTNWGMGVTQLCLATAVPIHTPILGTVLRLFFEQLILHVGPWECDTMVTAPCHAGRSNRHEFGIHSVEGPVRELLARLPLGDMSHAMLTDLTLIAEGFDLRPLAKGENTRIEVSSNGNGHKQISRTRCVGKHVGVTCRRDAQLLVHKRYPGIQDVLSLRRSPRCLAYSRL